MVKSNTHAERETIILDSLNEGVFTVDLDWRITSFNQAAERITQVPKQEAVGSRCCDVFHASVCETDCPLRRTMASGKPIVNALAYIINDQGERVPVRISTALLKDETGAIIGGVETFQDLSQIEELRKKLQDRYTFADIVGKSAAMQKLFAILPQVAESSSTVLLQGASGTGKELFARAIHNLSPRKEKPFVVVNCAALPDTLLESELFGYKAGAFTDATRDKPGKFALADGGTIFLDEIGDVSPAMQVRLLRVLQERTIEPLGALKPERVDVRVVAATNQDLADLVARGRFREDLFYRVRVILLQLPPLSQRRADIPLLIKHIVAKFNRLQGRQVAGVTDRVMAALLKHPFPGNVRELENILEQAFVLCRTGMITMEDLPPELRGAQEKQAPGPVSLAEMEKLLITRTLERCRGNRGRAAAELGINASTLYRKIKAYRIAVPEHDGRGKRGQ